METVRRNRILGILVLAVLVAMVTINQFRGKSSASASVAADTEKIGISVTNGDTFFIYYADITGAELCTGELEGVLSVEEEETHLSGSGESTEGALLMEDHLWYGTFTGTEGDTYLVCADPSVGSWIRVTTEKTNYLINSSTRKSTEELYDQISDR